MRLFRALRWLMIAGALIPMLALAQGTYQAKSVQGFPSSSAVPKAVAEAVEAQGASFVSGGGQALAEVWFSKAIPAAANPPSESDILYGAIAAGGFVGVLHVEKDTTDFRAQPVKSGYYTLRYELVPQDGNHMGVSEYRDFVLLIPAALDPDPSQTLSFNDVVKLSRKATNTGHPAVLTMDPAQSKSGSPAAFQDDQQHWALEASGKLQNAGGAKNFPMAIVLVGQSDAAQM